MIVLMGGGVDSASLLPFYKERGEELNAIHFNYGQPSARSELKAAASVCSHYSVPLEFLDFGMPMACVRGEYRARNALLVLAAAGTASSNDSIAIGIHAGTTYYDCSTTFLDDINRVLNGYFGGVVTAVAPFISFSKADVFRLAEKLRVPVELTYSCEVADGHPCGKCPSCLDRIACFGHQ